MKATLSERIVELLTANDQLDDDEIAGRLGVIRQGVNQACRGLEAKGTLKRATGPRGKIVNRLSGVPEPVTVKSRVLPSESDKHLSEDEVKEAVRLYLETLGYRVTVAWGRQHGIDIDATGPEGRLIIEAKGDVPSQPQQTNYFIGALGELVQRTSDPDAEYGLALPDVQTYRRLVSRLPELARDRLRLRFFFVARTANGNRVSELG
jgi:hypothetical protein